MSVHARRVESTPNRSTSETWTHIVDMLDSSNEGAIQELKGITGVVSSIISDRVPENHPFTFVGNGPRVRVYCIFDNKNDGTESPIKHDVLDGDWILYLPCKEADKDWITKKLRNDAPNINVITEGEEVPETNQSESKAVVIDEAAWGQL